MTTRKLFLLTAFVLLCPQGRAQESTSDDGPEKPATAGDTVTAPRSEVAYEAVRPCIQSGYVPYAYPGVGSCRCGDDGCFHPHRYYCRNSDYYKKGWLRKWVGAHLGKRSMLDDYPCECICPTTVPRPYLRTVKTSVIVSVEEPPRIPAPAE